MVTLLAALHRAEVTSTNAPSRSSRCAGEDAEFLRSRRGPGGALPGAPAEAVRACHAGVQRHRPGQAHGCTFARSAACRLHGGTVRRGEPPGDRLRFRVWLPYRAAAPSVQERQPCPRARPIVPRVRSHGGEMTRMAGLIEAQLRAEGSR